MSTNYRGEYYGEERSSLEGKWGCDGEGGEEGPPGGLCQHQGE